MTYHMKRLSKALIATAMGVTVLAGCEVTNPGPVQDEFLAQPASQQGLVNGAARRYAELMYMTYTTALLSREIFPAGQSGSFGHPVINQGGHILPGSFGGYFNDAVQARFIAETAIKRFTDVGAPANMLYQAHLWAGFAYKTLGENWCDAVIGSTDPDDPTPGSFEAGTTTYMQRALTNFTAALGFAGSENELNAARGGRAAVNAWLNQWAAVPADAALVPDEFEFQTNFDGQEQAYYNAVYWANANKPYKSYSMFATFHKAHYEATGDPRIPVYEDPAIPFEDAALSGFGQVPYSNQAKYTSEDDNQDLVSGYEMRLLEAEFELVQNSDPAAAMALINGVARNNPGRGLVDDINGNPLPALATSDFDPDPLTGAWAALKHERNLELWLENHRLTDLARWIRDSRPGQLDPDGMDWDSLSPIFSQNPRSYCFDIPTAEREQNPNVPVA